MLMLKETSPLFPITLSMVKTHLRLDHDIEDDLLDGLIRTSTAVVEAFLGLSLLEKVWIWRERADTKGVVHAVLPMGPLIEVESVSCLLPCGKKTGMRRFHVDVFSKKPTVVCYSHAPLEIIYRAGFGPLPKDVPAMIQHAILLFTATLYENRTGEVEIPEMIKNLLRPYKTVYV